MIKKKYIYNYKIISIVLFLFLIIWQLIALYFDKPKIFPGIIYLIKISFPSFSNFSDNNINPYLSSVNILFSNSIITFIRILVSLVVGILCGISWGLLIHYFGSTKKINSYLLTIIKNIPLFALIPLFIYWFGGKIIGIYIYITFGIFTIIATNTYHAVFNVQPSLISQGKLMGADKNFIFRKIIFYNIQPELLASIRNIVGLTWAFSLGAEYISANNGLGYLLYQSYLYADMGKLIIIAFLYSIYGIISLIIFNKISGYILRWH